MSVTTALDHVTYPDLFARWERGQWSATEIDFSEDRRHWNEELSEAQRRAALWNYSLFFHGEHAVAEGLGPYIDAAPEAEQRYFLATQQADEARHAVFFARFMDEVVGYGGGVGSALDGTRPQLTWGFRKVFERLEQISSGLTRDRSLPQLARGIAIYHLIVEATLAQPGQRIIERYLEQTGLLPGLLAGMHSVSRDEQRHIGFGVKMLAELTSRDEACREAVVDLIREAIPWVTGVFVPPGWDEASYLGVFGFTLEDMYEEGVASFESKLRAAGLPPESLHGAVPWPMELTPRERAERAVSLLRGGMVGERLGAVSREPDVVRSLFETMRLAVDERRLPEGGFTVQWRFDDAEPWHVTFARAGGVAAAGTAPTPDVTLRSRYEDWVDVFAGRVEPRTAILRRRVRPSGSLGALRRFATIFA